MVEVCRRGTPAIVEVAQTLLAEVRGYFFRLANLYPNVRQSDGLEANLTTSSGVERNRTVTLLSDCSDLMTIIEKCADDVWVQEDFDVVPVIRAHLRVVGLKG